MTWQSATFVSCNFNDYARKRYEVDLGSLDIGFLPFRAPAQTLSIDLVKRFARMPQVVAIKEESGAVDWVRTGRRVTEDSVPFITGGGENMVPYYYLAGAVGFTTGMANFTLPMSIKLQRSASDGKRRCSIALPATTSKSVTLIFSSLP